MANSRYATIREEGGDCYLFMKTIERAHTPKNLWEKIKLPSNYTKALDLVSEKLEHFPKYLVHRNKQRLTKIHQMLIRMRKLSLKARPKIVSTNSRVEAREKGRERKALLAAKLDRAIENELLERLRQATEGEIFNYPEQQYSKLITAATNKYQKESGEEVVDPDAEVEEEEEEENEQEREQEQEEVEEEEELEEEEEDEDEEEMVPDYNVEYVEDFEPSDDEEEEDGDIQDSDSDQEGSHSNSNRAHQGQQVQVPGDLEELAARWMAKDHGSTSAKKRKTTEGSDSAAASKSKKVLAAAVPRQSRVRTARVEIEYEREEEDEDAEIQRQTERATLYNSSIGAGAGTGGSRKSARISAATASSDSMHFNF